MAGVTRSRRVKKLGYRPCLTVALKATDIELTLMASDDALAHPETAAGINLIDIGNESVGPRFDWPERGEDAQSKARTRSGILPEPINRPETMGFARCPQ